MVGWLVTSRSLSCTPSCPPSRPSSLAPPVPPFFPTTGGGVCLPCVNKLQCHQNSDCKSGYCKGSDCTKEGVCKKGTCLAQVRGRRCGMAECVLPPALRMNPFFTGVKLPGALCLNVCVLFTLVPAAVVVHKHQGRLRE